MLRLPRMNRLELELAIQVGVWVAIFVALFVPLFVALFMRSSARKKPYLKCVAKKYSIPPLDLR